MSQKYKFFVNNKVVILCKNPGLLDEVLDVNHHYITVKYTDEEAVKRILDILQNDSNQSNYILFYSNLEELKEVFLNQFLNIEAAGGLVINQNEEVLLIHRLGFWDLPKGKIEEGETIEEAAVREVQEETGLEKVEIVSPIRFAEYLNKATYHSYPYQSQQAMKVSYWFKMECTELNEFTPQTEEDIAEVRWVKIADLPQYFNEMYPSIQDVILSVFSDLELK